MEFETTGLKSSNISSLYSGINTVRQNDSTVVSDFLFSSGAEKKPETINSLSTIENARDPDLEWKMEKATQLFGGKLPVRRNFAKIFKRNKIEPNLNDSASMSPSKKDRRQSARSFATDQSPRIL